MKFSARKWAKRLVVLPAIFALFGAAVLADAAESKIGTGLDAVALSLARNVGEVVAENGTLLVNGASFEFETRRTTNPPSSSLDGFESALPKNARCLRTGTPKRLASVCLSPRHPLGLGDIERILATRDFESLGPLHAAFASPLENGSSLLLLRSPTLPVAALLTPFEALSATALDSAPTDLSEKVPLLVVSRLDRRKATPLVLVTRKPLIEASAAEARIVRLGADGASWVTLRSRHGLFLAARLPE